MNIGLITTPVIAGFIGCITNALAIKMLFRPYKAVYIGRFHVPFTPGIIPSQKKRIISSIAQVVSDELLDSSILEEAFISDETVAAFREVLMTALEEYKNEDRITRAVILEKYPGEDFEKVIENVKWNIALYFRNKLLDDHIGGKIAEIVVKEAKDALEGHFFLKALNGAIDGLKDPFAENLDKYVEDNGVELIEGEISSVMDEYLDMKVCDLYREHEDKIPGIVDELEKWYRRMVKDNMKELLRIIDIRKLIEDRLSEFSPEELEDMIFMVMKKELNAIVYLGAILGFVIGLLNLVIMKFS